MNGNFKHLSEKLCHLLEIPFCLFGTESTKDLFDLSEILIRNDIRSMVVNMPLTNSTPIPLPAITKFKNEDFVIITSQQNSFIEIYAPEEKKYLRYTYPEFAAQFIPNILLIESLETKEVYESNHAKKKKSPLEILLNNSKLGIFSLFLLLILSFYKSIPMLAVGMLDLACFIISFAAFLERYNFHNNLFEKLCLIKNSTSESSCIQNGILSKYIPISFSTLGLLYFFLSLVLVLIYNGGLFIMYKWIILLGIPFILFSIYKQIFEYKKLCVLCLVLILLYIIKLIIYYFQIGLKINFETYPSLAELVLVALSIILIFMFEKYISMDKKMQKSNEEYNSIWSKRLLIERHLAESDLLKSLENNPSENTITLVAHLNCKYCLDTLDELVRLSLLNPEIDINLWVKYHQSDQNELMMKYLGEKLIQKDLLKVLDIFSDWKNGKFSNYKSRSFDNNVIELLNSNKKLFNNTSINQYPLIFKGSQLIPHYINAQNIKVAYARG